MIKLIGAVLVLVSACGIGGLLALQIKEQEKWLKEIKLSLVLLLGELEYRQMPLPEAASLLSVRQNGKLAAFFKGLAEELQKKEGFSLQELWRQQAEPVVKDSPLSREQREEFKELGLYFMESDKETRRNAVEFYLKRLEEDIITLRENGADRAYLCRTLGMLGGIFILILIL